MRNKIKLFGIYAVFATAASLIAGTIIIELGKPSANPEAQAKHAALVVRGGACSSPEKTTMTAMAEGIVKGKRESIPLKLIPLTGQNTFALTRQWPAEGKWVVTIVEANPTYKFQPSVIVKVDGDSVDWSSVTRLNRAPDAKEIEAALNTTVSAKLQEQK
jgi:hypothetical protein